MRLVSLMECSSYRRSEVFEAVKKAIDILGGLNWVATSGKRIIVKPNLLRPSHIERHVTTHPEVVRAVCKLLVDRGCNVVIAESPGGGTSYTERALRRAYRAAGLDEVAAELGIELNFDLSYKSVSAPASKLIKRFSVLTPVLEADALVNVCKLKTHLFTYITGATKNIFGVVPGIEKATYHSRLPSPADFSEMLVDLAELIKPRLNIMDAVVAMEGNGPNAGKTRKIGAILASESYSAMDVVACRLTSIPPLDVGVIRSAVGRGILREDLSNVKIVGKSIEEMIVSDFKRPSSYIGMEADQSIVWRALGRVSMAYALRPAMMRGRCRGIKACEECMRACPRSAISTKDDLPTVDYDKCIRCYCCHEICPNSAVALRRSTGGKIIKGLMDRRNKKV